MKLLRRITLPMLRQVKLSDARQKKYYIFNPKNPKPKIAERYQDETKYSYQEVQRGNNKIKLLVKNDTQEWVIKNPLAQGTPKYVRINFQSIWNSNVSDHTRNKVAESLHESYQEALSKIVPITEGFPLKTNFTMYTQLSNLQEQDVDNLTFLYIKTFHDALTLSGIIPDDKLKYIKRYEAGHEESDSDYIVVDIYSIPMGRVTRRSLMMAS